MRILAALAVAIPVVLAAAPAQAQTRFVIDAARTHIRFTIDAIGFPTTRGEFHDFDGRLSIDFAHPQRSKVQFTVRTASVDVGSRGLNAYIASPVFLNAEKFPEMSFVSTGVRKLDERTALVDGNLTLMGVTQPAAFRVQVDMSRGRRQIGFVAGGVIRRSAFGMISGQPIISDKVSIEVATEARAR